MPVTFHADDIENAIDTLAQAIRLRHPSEPLTLIGIRSRGDEVAERLCTRLAEDDREIHLGILDISLYRDDFGHLRENPKLQGSEIDVPLDDATVILVDDVLFTGRTIRAALDALSDYGRPSKVELAVLIDRGHREMPISADFIGISLATERLDHVMVSLENTDGKDQIELIPHS
ncbi:MAG: bifunctional pyr operon transcriptional regulator/uracil phosphoribosyltransferase PyrR [Verrucomicrobia bacterium]|nr:MAG: bifunctional pyr operon transcriptional regulator/uracil phosphoribosyltransferase PyrR [Verrucomicrobiota bacterium]